MAPGIEYGSTIPPRPLFRNKAPRREANSGIPRGLRASADSTHTFLVTTSSAPLIRPRRPTVGSSSSASDLPRQRPWGRWNGLPGTIRRLSVLDRARQWSFFASSSPASIPMSSRSTTLAERKSTVFVPAGRRGRRPHGTRLWLSSTTRPAARRWELTPFSTRYSRNSRRRETSRPALPRRGRSHQGCRKLDTDVIERERRRPLSRETAEGQIPSVRLNGHGGNAVAGRLHANS